MAEYFMILFQKKWNSKVAIKIFKNMNPVIGAMVLVLTFFGQGFCADFDETLRANYDHIERIGRQLQNNPTEAELDSEILRVRSAIAKLTYGDFYNPKTVTHYARLIAEQSIKYGVDPMLIVSIVSMESSFRDWVVSDVGAVGLMQLRLPTARYIAKKMGLSAIKSWRELFNSKTNISLGVAYIAYLIKLTGSVEHGLIAYNIGPTNLYLDIQNNYLLPMDYVHGVMGRYDEIKSLDVDPVF